MKKIIMFIVMLILLITGCATSGKEREKREEYKEQAKENAVKYIEQKYGFIPEILSAECTFSNSDMFSSSCLSDVIVNFEYNGKKSQVLVSGDKESIKGKDNYQSDELSNYVINKLKEKTGLQVYKYLVKIGYDENNLIEQKYTSENIENFLNDEHVAALVEYIDEKNFKTNINLENLTEFKKIVLINYHSIDTYKKAESHRVDSKKDTLEENAIYIKNAVIKQYKNFEYYEFNLDKKYNMYFSVEAGKTLSINKSTIDELSNWDKRTAKAKKISDDYSINNVSDSIMIYFPFDDYKRYDLKKIELAIQCNGIDGKKYFTSNPFSVYKVGEYIAVPLNLSSCDDDVRFTIIYNK